MAEFLIKLANERGHVLEQLESGISEKEVRERFAQQGYLVYSVKSQNAFSLTNWFGRGRKRIKTDPFIVFNQQFVTLIKAGLPIMTSLELLGKRQKDPFFKTLLDNVRDRVKSGQLLSDAFAAHDAVPKVYTTTLLAGERSGNLEEVLARYVAFQKVTTAFRKKFFSSLWYPGLLLIALTVMLTFLITYVVPRFADLYNSMNADLPAITVFMLALGTTIQHYYPLIVIALAAAVVAVISWIRTDHGQRTLDAARFKVPLLGQIWMKYQVSMFSRTLSTLLSGGLPLVPSLQTACDSINSYKIARTVEQAAKRVQEGRSLSYSLEETQFFPELAIEMIEVGESTGALPGMLNSVAEFYEDDVQNALTAALQLIEPILLLFMGATVALVLISLYLPIFSLGSRIQ
ncbi:MAG TPA: type II secretion system F family protein [Alphaproteobacteria bacterium]|nr:type II secretion system F family protein [Alphaproteobacteria bacterium]